MRIVCNSNATTGSVLYDKLFLEILQNSQENTCARVSFLIKLKSEASNFIKKETLAQVFSCVFCYIFKDTFFTEHLQVTASGNYLIFLSSRIFIVMFCNQIFYAPQITRWYHSLFPFPRLL